jgi:AcrR family transcriptional regulator
VARIQTEEVSSRTDARRNRTALISAARELFATGGLDVTTRDIAGQAGVGIGTLYRHFPTREDLVDAVLADAFDELVAIAEQALAEPDAAIGFRRFIEQALLLHARNRGLKDVVETQTHGRERAAAMRGRIRTLVARLVARAQEQGALRADFAPQDIALLFWASDHVIEMAAEIAPEIWRRQLGFVLDGLKPESATTLPLPPLTEAQLRRVGARKTRRT